ncbi:MAG: hypothetical protein Q9Q40_10375 [Acidobacteriota bacterium]|nr:hypothetical protein [Acidobacteriota bacterium]
MTRRLVLLTMMLSLATLPALGASAPGGMLPHDKAPYYLGPTDGPISMTVDPTGTMWAVWAYDNGAETDIAITRSIGDTWSVPVLVGVYNRRDDRDPRIAFMADGTPVLGWWQAGADDDPTSFDRVLLSFFLDGEWSAPVQLSLPDAHGRQPNFFDTGADLEVGFLQIDPATGRSEIDIRPVEKPRPGGGTNGPDPLPTFTIGGDEEVPEGGTGDNTRSSG